MNTQLPIIHDPPPETPKVCRLLRTKTAYGTYGTDMEDWQLGESTTAVYWCLGTMETAGPDDAIAYPTSCMAGRVCYQPGE